MLKSESFYGQAERCTMHSEKDLCGDFDSSVDFDCCDDEQCSVPGISVVRAQQKKFSPLTCPLWMAPRKATTAFSGSIETTFNFTLHNFALPPPEGLLILWQRFLI